jgi:4-hydroxybenzoate polyprenyltransferase
LVQAALAAWLMPRLLVLLVLEWCWLALMAREFFVSAWLRKRPVHYLWSHMLILPLMDFYLSAWDWAPSGGPPHGLAWLLGVSFLNGVVIEIGRKTRAPADEEAGVETYSALWGRARAIAVWLAAIVTTAVLALAAARRIQFAGTVAIVVGMLLALVIASAYSFLRSPEKGRGKRIETAAGVWTLILYTSLGLLPMALRAWSGR